MGVGLAERQGRGVRGKFQIGMQNKIIREPSAVKTETNKK